MKTPFSLHGLNKYFSVVRVKPTVNRLGAGYSSTAEVPILYWSSIYHFLFLFSLSTDIDSTLWAGPGGGGGGGRG